MDEKATLVVTAVPNPEEMAAVQEYLHGVLPLLTGAGGTVVKRLRTEKIINGNPAGMTLVMDFDSGSAITDLFESVEYAALVPVRDRGFRSMDRAGGS